MDSHTPSLTGSACGAPLTHSACVSIALGRLRVGVLFCCLLVVAGLITQAVIWSLVTFTELRWTNVSNSGEAPLVVQAGDESMPPARSSLRPARDAAQTRDPVDPNRIPSHFDRIFTLAASLAGGIGSLAAAALIPLIALGVLLAASSATEGVDRTVSAFGWGIAVAFLCMPVADKAGLPWEDGAFWSYSSLTTFFDGHEGPFRIDFYARYLLLPGACGIGIAMVAMRFAAGVQAGLLVKEDLRVDAHLEHEAANRRPGSLHGGRASMAMQGVQGSKVASPSAPSSGGRSIRQLTAGEAPRRLI